VQAHCAFSPSIYVANAQEQSVFLREYWEREKPPSGSLSSIHATCKDNRQHCHQPKSKKGPLSVPGLQGNGHPGLGRSTRVMAAVFLELLM